MSLAKTGNIKNVCLPNALVTLQEYACDYGSEEFKRKTERLIALQLPNIKSEAMRETTKHNIEAIKAGARDLYV
jgi:2-iminoacetate synthase